MVFEHQAEHASQWATTTSIASKFGMTAETLRTWVRRAEVDAGARAGLTTGERERLRQLERENRELRRANEIRRRPRFFSHGSSTRNCRNDPLHRDPPRALRGRADLSRTAGRPVDVLRRTAAPAIGPSHTGRGAAGEAETGPRRALRGLRRTQALAPAHARPSARLAISAVVSCAGGRTSGVWGRRPCTAAVLPLDPTLTPRHAACLAQMRQGAIRATSPLSTSIATNSP